MNYDLIIIGGGPAGITAGIYAGRQRLKTLLLTKEFGGQMIKKSTEVCNYPGFARIEGKELIKKFVDHLREQGIADIKFGEAADIGKKNNKFVVITKAKDKFFADSVIIATGAEPKPLNVAGEKEFIGRGVSYCVTCDGPLFKNRTIAVAGGGNAGFEAAIFMAGYAKKIYILEAESKIRADKDSQEIARKSKKIKVITNAAIKKIEGNVFVSSLTYQDLIEKKEKTIKLDGVFIEIGTKPMTSFIKNSKLVAFNKKGEIKVDLKTYQTKTPGLFTAGDANEGKYKQIVIAAGQGCKAALSSYDYLYSLKKIR
jgi:thioredoxin-disulfide reductase